jgi:hypothetical protein
MARGSRLVIKDTGIKKFLTRVDFDLAAGIAPDDAQEQHPAGNGGRPLTMGELGSIHEHGSEAGNVPARSWLRGWFDENKDRTIAEIRAALKPAALSQLWNDSRAPAALEAAARTARNGIVQRIAKGIDPTLAESTLAKKAPKVVPLIDSRAFIDAISVQITSRKGSASTRGRRVGWNYAARAGKGGTSK